MGNPSLLFLAFLTWLASVIWVALTRPRPINDAACCRCGYSLGKLRKKICPECGADLRNVGVVMPRTKPVVRGSLRAAVIAWSVLCPLLVLYLEPAVAFLAKITSGTTPVVLMSGTATKAFFLSWLLAWGIGTCLIVRRRRKLVRAAGAAPTR